MYQPTPIFPPYPKEKRKFYLRRLLGRLNRLKKMVIRREVEVIPDYQSHIEMIDFEIQKLQKKKDKWLSKISDTRTELSNIRSEMVDYTVLISKYVKDDPDSYIKPLFMIREVPKRRNGVEYFYFEGRVRGRTVKGNRSRDKDYQLGKREVLPQLIQKELGIQIDVKIKYSELEELLKQIVEKWWLEDLGTTSLWL